MNRTLTHRGPDDEGYYLEGPAGLAARRLSIIDLETGHQPLGSQSNRHWITYNGEVYNFKELRTNLESRGFVFKTKTDTEVLVNLYEEYGPDFVEQLRGMFAFGIYDKPKGRLILGRDRLGIKPLYYWENPASNTLVFGSEIKAILEYPGVGREIDPEALDLFLTLEYIPAPFSIFKSIRKLPAGHILVYEKGILRLHKYWDVVPPEHMPKEFCFNELKERFHDILSESVKIRMISDVPLGAFLSGGVDSSSIVATMSRFSSQPVKTFSIGFEEKSYSELEYSSIVSKEFKTDHYTKILNPDINELVHRLSDIMDEPLGDFSNFPTFLVSEAAREKVTVVLSGDGGDEIFGGYEHYIAQKMARFIDVPFWRPFHHLAAQISGVIPPSPLKKGWINRVKRFGNGLYNSPVNRHFRWMMFYSEKQKQKLYSPSFLREDYLKPLPERAPFDIFFKFSEPFDEINRDLYLDLKTYMVDDILVKVDRMSMAASLEARVPLLDHHMVEFAFTLPSYYKLNGPTTKWFFKKAMEGILPNKIIYRQKEGFSIPLKSWLKNELKELMLEYLFEKRVKDDGFFNYSFIKDMVSAHLSGKQDHSHRLWPLILFNLWRKKYSNA